MSSIRLDDIEVSSDDLAHYDELFFKAKVRKDSNETMLLARQLEYVKAQVYEKKYPAFKALSLLPLASGTPNAAEVIRYKIWDQFGSAKMLDHYGTDLPSVGAFARDATSPVKGFGNSYGYSIQDIRAAAYAGVSLDARMAMAAKRAHEYLLDELCAKGLPSSGMPGFVNHPNVGLVSPITGDWANSGTDAGEIVDDLNKLVSAVVNTSKGVHAPDTLVLPTRLFEIASNKRIGANEDRSALKAFLEGQTHIKHIESWSHLESAGADGGNRIVAYERSAEILEAEVPQQFEQFPAQAQGLMFNIPCHSRSGGCVIHLPLGLSYMDGC